jgi:DNA modification methylase
MTQQLVINGDALTVLRTIGPNTVTAIVTDPPAGISFMGKEWDGDRGGREAWISWMSEIMRECFRILKPGAHALVWALPRTAHWTATAVENAGFEIRDVIAHLFGNGMPKSRALLKPAREDWILARKPGPGTLQIEACRVPFVDAADEKESKDKNQHGDFGSGVRNNHVLGADKNERCNYEAPGRWPTNLIHDGSTETLAGFAANGNEAAHRFFYCPKPTTAEREAGLVASTGARANDHPTVKAIALMRYLIRLVTPVAPNSVVVDPFAGSGTTGCASALEGVHFFGIEQDPHFVAIANQRIAHWARSVLTASAPT